MAQPAAHTEHQEHPIKLYLVVWGLLFVLSLFSYMVDYLGVHGYLRWSLILLFMILEGRANRCNLHAYGVGEACPYLCDIASTAARAGVRGDDGFRIALRAFQPDDLLRRRSLAQKNAAPFGTAFLIPFRFTYEIVALPTSGLLRWAAVPQPCDKDAMSHVPAQG